MIGDLLFFHDSFNLFLFNENLLFHTDNMCLRRADIVVKEGLDNGSSGDDGFLSIDDHFILGSFKVVLAAVVRGIPADELSEVS